MSENIEVILVDAGNTSIKSVEYSDSGFVNRKQWGSISELSSYYYDKSIAISAVNTNLRELKSSFSDARFFILDYEARLPIELNYDTPETLGVDRIALAVGANFLFPKNNNLVIDLGTCITIDVIDKQGIFQGGTISPGLKMRMQAMSYYTANLPDISEEWESVDEELIGKTTRQGLLNGSFSAILFEIKGIVDHIEKQFPEPNLILCGGDAHYFDGKMNALLYPGSEIADIGLYRVWKHQSNS